MLGFGLELLLGDSCRSSRVVMVTSSAELQLTQALWDSLSTPVTDPMLSFYLQNCLFSLPCMSAHHALARCPQSGEGAGSLELELWRDVRGWELKLGSLKEQSVL